MKHLVMYSTFKHGNDSEDLRICIDTELTKKTKKILLAYLLKTLSMYDLTYEESYWKDAVKIPEINKLIKKKGGSYNGEYILTIDELDEILNSTEYDLGHNIGGYLYPTGIRFTMIEDETVFLSNIVEK